MSARPGVSDSEAADRGVQGAAKGTGLRDAVKVLHHSLVGAKRDGIAMTAQALAYSLFLAIPSTFLVLLGVFSLVASPTDAASLVHRADGVIPTEASTLLTGQPGEIYGVAQQRVAPDDHRLRTRTLGHDIRSNDSDAGHFQHV